jgi:hypothetical protein
LRDFYYRVVKLFMLTLLISLLFITFLSGKVVAQTETAITENQYMLDLKLPMPYIPADSKAYPLVVQVVNKEGQPRFLTKDIIITLSSSNPTIGYTESTILLKAGQSSTLATFHSTFNIGSTNITASASGLASSTITVRTVGISGAPVKLAAYILPNKVLAKNGTKAIVVIELQDGNSLPARATEDITISLSSSVTKVGIIDPKIILHRNSTFAVAYFYPTDQPGSTIITASASGLQSTTLEVKTLAYNPNKLALYLLPSILPKQSKGMVIVQLQDSRGRPITATSDVKVILTSSNTSVAALDTNFLTIQKGMNYGSSYLTTGNLSASAIIYAVAQGYESAEATIQVMETKVATSGLFKIFAVPILLADDRQHIIIATVTMNNNLTSLVQPPYPLKIYFSSSNTRVGRVTEVVWTTKEYAYSEFTSSTVGCTTITALADNFNASQTTITVVEEPKFKLDLCICPSLIPIDSPYKPIVIVEAQNEYGEPLLAPANIDVNLFSSNKRVGTVEAQVLINQSHYYTTSSFSIASDLGVTTITAAASNFASATAEIATFRVGASKIYLGIEPSVVIADNSATQNIFVMLQDMYGYPANAPRDTLISLSSSNIEIGSLPSSLIIPKGEAFAFTYFKKSNKEGITQITAHSEGLQPSVKTLSSILLEPAVKIGASSLKVYTYDYLTIYVKVQFEGQPLSGAEVSWSTTATLLEVSQISNAEGVAKAVFTSPREGEYIIKAQISKAGFRKAEADLQISVKPRSLNVEAKAPLEARTFEEVEVLIKITEDGRPIEGALVTLKPSQGKITIKNNQSDVNGEVKAVFQSNDGSKVTIYYTVKKTGYVTSNGSLSINVKPHPLSLTLTTNASVIHRGDVLEVTALVCSDLKPVENATLNWNIIGGVVLRKTNVTDRNGIGRLILKSNEEASVVYINVVATKRGYSSALASTSIGALPLPFYQSITKISFWQKNPWFAGLVAVPAIVLAFLIRSLRKRKEAAKLEELEAADAL